MRGEPSFAVPDDDIRTRVLLQHQKVADDAMVVQQSVSALHSLVAELVEENSVLRARLGDGEAERPIVMTMRTVRDAYCGGATSGFWKDLGDATDVVMDRLRDDELPTPDEITALEPWTGAIMTSSKVMPNVLVWAFLSWLSEMRAAVAEEASIDDAVRSAVFHGESP